MLSQKAIPNMTAQRGNTFSVLAVICVPGILGVLSAAELCGIGMCSFIPLTTAVIMHSSLVAVATVFTAFICNVRWSVPPLVFSLSMLAPALISATSLLEEWLRFHVATGCIVAVWIGSYILGSRTKPL